MPSFLPIHVLQQMSLHPLPVRRALSTPRHTLPVRRALSTPRHTLPLPTPRHTLPLPTPRYTIAELETLSKKKTVRFHSSVQSNPRAWRVHPRGAPKQTKRLLKTSEDIQAYQQKFKAYVYDMNVEMVDVYDMNVEMVDVYDIVCIK